jgi:hypothetical protein
MRFKSQAELAAHLDDLFIRNQSRQRKEGRSVRQWYIKESQWITDCGVFSTGEETERSKAATPSPADGAGDDTQQEEEMVVPADEHFTRCPVSHEAFMPEWDEEEGDFMYRHAVKVLITAKADNSLFKVSQSTGHPLIRYAIVHQNLVMDGWQSSGKAVTLADGLVLASKQHGDGSDVYRTIVNAFMAAAGEDEDTNDIFVLIEGSGEGSGIGGEVYGHAVLHREDGPNHDELDDSSSHAEMKMEGELDE